MIIGGMDFGAGRESVLANNARDLLQPSGGFVEDLRASARLMVDNTPGAAGCSGWMGLTDAQKQERATAHAAWANDAFRVDALMTAADDLCRTSSTTTGITSPSVWNQAPSETFSLVRFGPDFFTRSGMTCAAWGALSPQDKVSRVVAQGERDYDGFTDEERRRYTLFVQRAVPVMDRVCRSILNPAPGVYPAGDPLTATQSSLLWGFLGVVTGAAVSGGVYWAIRRSKRS